MKRMVIKIFSLLLLITVQVRSADIVTDSVIDTRYHTYAEVVAYLDSIQQIPAYNAILDVRQIGISNNEELPIYAVKFSDNPTVDEDEAALLFLGQCHAEEILGLEITMGLIDSLLHGFDSFNPHIISIIQNLEVWIVPTYNPEGLRVVHDGLDVTYRKNKTDNNGNGTFDFVPGIGYDIDGVDFNRNYNFNWIFGDAYEVGDYDYYRGPTPFSESEVRAIADLAHQENFLLSVAYHSARSGTPEIIYYSWEWEQSKTPPDHEVISDMATTLSHRIINESGDGNYAVTPGKTPRGNAHDWFYTQTGAIQFLIEVGTNNLQPNSSIIDDTVQRNLEGLFYLMDRAFGSTPESKAQIRGVVTDNSDGFALEGAQVRLAKWNSQGSLTELEGLMMEPRVSDEYGRYRRLVTQGTYRVIASAPGFVADTVGTILASDSYATILDFSLEPMPIHQIILDLTQTEGIETYEVIIWDEEVRDTLALSPGLNSFNWQSNYLNLKVSTDGYFPELHQHDLTLFSTDLPLNISVTLPQGPTTAYSTNFDDISDWNIVSGPWIAMNGRLNSQEEIFYSPELDVEIRLANIDLTVVDDIQRLGIYLRHAYEVEWQKDTLIMELWSSDESELLLRHEWVDQQYENHVETFLIHDDLPTSALLKLQMKTDSTVVFRGWNLDSLAIFVSEAEAVSIDPAQEEHTLREFSGDQQASASLSPNPLKAYTQLQYTLPKSNLATVKIYDIRGREIYTQKLQVNPGVNSWTWQGQNLTGHPVSAGLYFVHLIGVQESVTTKLMVMSSF